MACGSCSTGGGCGSGGCSSGACATGSCNRLNTFDWLSHLEIEDVGTGGFVEINFDNGSRKDFFIVPPKMDLVSGDMVLVDTGAGGYDLGRIALSGELANLQLKRKKVNPKSVLLKVIRRANQRDIDRMMDVRLLQKPTMVQSRAIVASLSLEMKICDVEYQADGKKATFFYTAEGRVDFRELIRHFSKDFKVRIEMRQIGPRQETARLGGIGSCGRELCCSTWMTDFKGVTTGAARYQNLAINQAKLSGQCGRLKCCLNFELDTYLDALEHFPDKPERIQTLAGTADMIKMDVFRGFMTYTYHSGPEKGSFFVLDKEKVRELKDLAKAGTPAESLRTHQMVIKPKVEAEGEEDIAYADVTGAVELKDDPRKKKSKRPNRKPTGAVRDTRGPRPPQQEQSPRPPQAERGPRPPQAERGPRPPQADRGPRPPQQEQGPRPPQADRGPRPPQQERGPRPPQQERGPRPPQADRGPRPPQQERGPKPPQADRGPRPPKDPRPPQTND